MYTDVNPQHQADRDGFIRGTDLWELRLRSLTSRSVILLDVSKNETAPIEVACCEPRGFDRWAVLKKDPSPTVANAGDNYVVIATDLDRGDAIEKLWTLRKDNRCGLITMAEP